MSDINDGHYPTRAELHEQIDAHAKENAKLLLRVAELDAKGARRENELLERLDSETAALREQVATLTQQLDAARVNSRETLVSMRKDIDALIVERDAAKADAARAELRARDLYAALDRLTLAQEPFRPVKGRSAIELSSEWQANRLKASAFAREALSANPDSDERLREVMRKVHAAGRERGLATKIEASTIERDIDEALGVKS